MERSLAALFFLTDMGSVLFYLLMAYYVLCGDLVTAWVSGESTQVQWDQCAAVITFQACANSTQMRWYKAREGNRELGRGPQRGDNRIQMHVHIQLHIDSEMYPYWGDRGLETWAITQTQRNPPHPPPPTHTNTNPEREALVGKEKNT